MIDTVIYFVKMVLFYAMFKIKTLTNFINYKV